MLYHGDRKMLTSDFFPPGFRCELYSKIWPAIFVYIAESVLDSFEHVVWMVEYIYNFLLVFVSEWSIFTLNAFLRAGPQ